MSAGSTARRNFHFSFSRVYLQIRNFYYSSGYVQMPFLLSATSAINSKGLKQYAQPLSIGITFIGIKHHYNDVADRMA